MFLIRIMTLFFVSPLLLIASPLLAGDLDATFSLPYDIKYDNYPTGSGYSSYYLDNCYTFANDCGTKTAADAWCRDYIGFLGGAISQQAGATIPTGAKTKIIGDGRTCSGNCGTYQSITCTTANPTRFIAPKYRGFRLDSTEHNGSGAKTDAQVAEIFCQSFGFEDAFNSYSIGNVGEPTNRIGDDSLCNAHCGGFTSITCGTFKVKYPITGKQLETGQLVPIRWTEFSNGNPVKIELYKNGAFYRDIERRHADDGEYEWVVDDDLPEGTGYAIKVSEYFGKYTDSVNVRISHPGETEFINIQQPSTSNTYYRGNDVNLTWLNSSSITGVKIELLNTANSVIRTIRNRISSTGNFNWAVPLDLSEGHYKIRISSFHNNTVFDDTPIFTIAKQTHHLKVTINNQNGKVTDSKNRINCPTASCETSAYENGESVTLTATPSSGYTFDGFSGCTTISDTCTFTLDSDKTISARFSSTRSYQLTTHVSAEGSAKGTVSSTPPGINQCEQGNVCRAGFQRGSITLTATPDENSEAHYSGCNQTSGNQCTVNLNSDKTIQVSFQPKPTHDEELTLEFDPFPIKNIYTIQELTQDANGLQVRVRVKRPNSSIQIDRVELDWTGAGNTTQCQLDTGANVDLLSKRFVCFSKDLDNNPFRNGVIYTMTSTAYGASSRSNMLRFHYKVVTSSDSEKYTGTQNPDHMEKFWVVDPNTDKKGFFVDTARGTQVLQLNFLHQIGIVGLDFSLQYNSGFAEQETGKLGKGWSHNYGMLARLDLSNENQEITVKWSNNRKLTLTKIGNEYRDNYTSTGERIEAGRLSGQYDKLIKDVDGTYLFTKKDKSKYRFDKTGKLTFIKNKYQQVFALQYDGDRLKKIREIDSANNDTGIYLNYEYDASGRINIIRDATRRVALYYQNDCLTAISDPENIEHHFIYETGTCLLKKHARYQPGDGTIILFQDNVYDAITGALLSQKDGKGQTTTFSYDEAKPGLITTTITSPIGYQTTSTYNTNYQLIDHQVIDGSTVYQTQYSYTQTGMLHRKREAPRLASESQHTSLERVTSYEYDTNGNTATVIYPDGASVERIYDTQNNLIQEKNEQGLLTYYTYNPSNNTLKSKSYPYGPGNRDQISYEYNDNAQVETIIKPNALRTSLAYENGRLKTLTDPEGNTTSYTYDAAGNIKTSIIRNASGETLKTTSFDYDKLDRATRQTTYYQGTPLSAVSEYGVCGLAKTTDAKNNVTQYQYDDNCNLITLLEPEGQTTQYEYDAEDRKIATINASNHKSGVGYNALGLVTEEWIQDGASPKKILFKHTYDRLGRKEASYQQADDVGNGEFRTAYQEYDNRDRTTRQADAHHYMEYYYSNGRLYRIDEHDECNIDDATICSDSFRKTTFSYYDDNKLANVVDAENNQAQQSFDARGNRIQLRDPKSNATGFAYDGNDKEKQQTPAAGEPATRQYNALGLLDWVRNGRGQQESYTYYENGWLQSITLENKTWTYNYDANGNIRQITGPDGTISRTFDALDRVGSYTDIYGNTIKYTYYPNSQLKSLQFDGHTMAYTYDAYGRLDTVSWNGSEMVNYAYTRQGRLKTETRSNGTRRNYVYTKDRLTQITDRHTSNNTLIHSSTLEYNSVSDITKEIVSPEPTLDQLKIPAVQMTYQADNRLETYNGTRVWFDDDGNMTEGPLGDQFATFSYDVRNRLTSVGDTEYTYNIENHRIKVSENGQETEYFINPHAELSQVLFKQAPDGTKTYYIYGHGLIAQIADNATRFYHYDLRGSTVALTDDSGLVTDRVTYMPYGEITSRTGDTETPFLYIGKYNIQKDSNSLYRMRARYYNFDARRFLTKDILLGDISIIQTLNRYAYTGGNPILRTDPTGLTWRWLSDLGDGINNTASFVKRSTVSAVVKGKDTFVDFSEEVFRNVIYEPGMAVASSIENTYEKVLKAETKTDTLMVIIGGGGEVLTIVGVNALLVSRKQGLSLIGGEAMTSSLIKQIYHDPGSRDTMLQYNGLAFSTAGTIASIGNLTKDLAKSLGQLKYVNGVLHNNKSNPEFNNGLKTIWNNLKSDAVKDLHKKATSLIVRGKQKIESWYKENNTFFQESALEIR